MPESTYCLKCGAKLPELPPRPGIDRGHGKLGRLGVIVDMIPGLFSLRTLLHVLAAWGGAALFILLARTISPIGRGGFSVILCLPLFLLLYGSGIMLFVVGVGWLIYGKYGSPIEAFADFSVRDWLVFLVLVCLGATVFFGALF